VTDKGAAALDRSTLESDLSNSVAEFKSYLTVIEKRFLANDRKYLEGDKLSMADIHVLWAVQATLDSLAVLELPNFSMSAFPKTQSWITRIPTPQPRTVSSNKAYELIMASGKVVTETGFDVNDALKLKKGELVAVDMADDLGRSRRSPQVGRIDGLDPMEIVLKLENGVKVHFPRIGIVVKKVD
jgi:hypothetical protein